MIALVLMLGWLAACGGGREAAAPMPDVPEGTGDYHIIAYVLGTRSFDLSQIQAEKLTHINYAFANVVDGQVTLMRNADTANLQKLVALKSRNPNLKVLLSVGGWSWSENFSDAALTDSSREVFAQSAANLVAAYHLDGVDIDWEYPGQYGEDNVYRSEDKENFTLLLKAVREHLDTRAARNNRPEGYLLTIATGADITYQDHTDLGTAQQYLDFINVMTYDFYGAWSERTGHHTALFPSEAEGAGGLSAMKGVQRHLAAGVPVEKLVLGAAFYGRGWRGVEPEQNGLFQPYDKATGGYSYAALDSAFIDKNGYARYWDEAARAPYLWNADSLIFISYDDPQSLRHKAAYVKRQGLAGIMYWEYSHDPEGKLLGALHEALR